MINTFRIAWIAIRELLYEKVFYLLVCFALAAMGLSMLLGQLTYAEQAKLTLDFMLGGIELAMILFSVFMGITLFQRELYMGSVSMVLSKPVSRASFLMGKFLGQITVQFGVILAMGGITLLVCQRFGTDVSPLAIMQCVLMTFLEIMVLTSITYFFVVNAGVVTTAVVTLSLFALGHVGQTINDNLNHDSLPMLVWRMVKGVLPNLEVFNTKAIASYGLSLAWGTAGWAVVYALCCTTFFLLLATLCFNRKDILT